MPLMPNIWSRSLFLVAVVFGMLSFFAQPDVSPEYRARLNIRALLSELFLHEGLAGMQDPDELCATKVGLQDWKPEAEAKNQICVQRVMTSFQPILAHLKSISDKSNLPSSSDEALWAKLVLQLHDFDSLGDQSLSTNVELPEGTPMWLRTRQADMRSVSDVESFNQQLHTILRNTWSYLKPWAVFFSLLMVMSLMGIVAWFLKKRIFVEPPPLESRVSAISPVDAFGFVGLWVLFRLVWGAIFPIFGLVDPLAIVFMDYLPSAFFGLFLIYTACSKAKVGWGDIGLRIPNSFSVWKKAIGLSILAFMMALPLVYFCQILNALVWSSYDLMAPLMLRIYEGGDMLPFAFISVGVAAVFEELLFRGLLFSSLRARTNLERTNWLQAIAFALFHFNPTSFLPLLALGMVIGRVRETTTSVLPCIIVHALWNLTVCLVTYYQLGA